MQCVEVVVYEIRRGYEKEFHEAYEWILEEMGALPGFLAAETLQSLDDGHRFVDFWTWESVEDAKQAHDEFARLPHAKAFMNAVERVLVSGHYRPCL